MCADDRSLYRRYTERLQSFDCPGRVGTDYELHSIDLAADEQKTPAFLQINPNGRIPAIVDRDEDDFVVFESGAVLIYLADKTGQLLPQDPKKRSEVIQWLMFQMVIGSMQGASERLLSIFRREDTVVIERYQKECRRLFEVLDRRLEDREFICNEFSIADIATWPLDARLQMERRRY